MSDDSDDKGSRLLKAVEAIAIHPKDARALVAKYLAQSRIANPSLDQSRHQEQVADKIISRYCLLSATSGGATALVGVVPGLGTVAAMLGGGLTDAAVSMKLQVDMTMCLAETFGWDLDTEDARHLAFLIAAGGTLEKAGAEAATRIACRCFGSTSRELPLPRSRSSSRSSASSSPAKRWRRPSPSALEWSSGRLRTMP